LRIEREQRQRTIKSLLQQWREAQNAEATAQSTNLPNHLKPMLATSAPKLPIGDTWTYEVKWDGYRVLAVMDSARVRLVSRNQKDLTRDYPGVVAAVASLPAKHAVLDGELVAVDAHGRPSFQALQHRATTHLTLAYYAFDLLELDGESWIRQPLAARRRRLAELVAGSTVLLSEPLPGTVADIERAIRRLGLEGVVAKRGTSVY
jgi:ATP-dependent DNA ligase